MCVQFIDFGLLSTCDGDTYLKLGRKSNPYNKNQSILFMYIKIFIFNQYSAMVNIKKYFARFVFQKVRRHPKKNEKNGM